MTQGIVVSAPVVTWTDVSEEDCDSVEPTLYY